MSKQMSKVLLNFSFLILSFTPCASIAVEVRCSEILITDSASTFWGSAKSYGKDVVQTKGVRLFLKDSEQDNQEIKWHGFLTKQNLNLNLNKTGIKKFLSNIFSYVPRKIGVLFSREDGYSFTPFVGLYNLTLKMPTEYLTNIFGNRKMQPAFFFKFPVVMTLSLVLYNQADLVYEHKLQNHIQDQIAIHAIEYNHDIQSNFKFHKIKEATGQGVFASKKALEEARLVTLAYSQYYEFLQSNNNTPTLESNMKLIDHYLFKHLKNVILYGVHKVDLSQGYFVPDLAVGKITDAQIMELFSNNHQRYLKYEIVSEMVKETELWKEMLSNPKMKSIFDSIINDPFTVELYKTKDLGFITNDELLYYLQEDLYWQNQFQDNKTIGVTRLKSKNRHYISEALTLSDVREEILAEIASKYKSSLSRP